MIRVMLAAALCLAAGCNQAGLPGGENGERSQQKADRASAGPAILPAEVVAKMDASGLWQEYGENAIAADAKYKGRIIEVSGPVRKVSTDKAGRYYAGFVTVGETIVSPAAYAKKTPLEKQWYNQGYPPNVICYIHPDKQAGFAGIKRDAQAGIVGRCRGIEQDDTVYRGYIVVLEDCAPAR